MNEISKDHAPRTFSPRNNSQMLAVKIQQHLVSPLVLLPDPLVLQVGARGHPAVDLVAEGLDVLCFAARRKVLAERFHGVGVFVAGREHAEGDLDAFGVGGVDHGGVDFGGGGEGGAGLGGQGDDLLCVVV